jgi:hypothetical protein
MTLIKTADWAELSGELFGLSLRHLISYRLPSGPMASWPVHDPAVSSRSSARATRRSA